MRSWQQRLAVADRRFSIHAISTAPPATDTDPREVSGPIESSTVTLAAAPSAATQLAALLRGGPVPATGTRPVALLAGTA